MAMIILWFFVLLAAALLAWLAYLPAKYRVAETQKINATPAQVFEYLQEFRNWPNWSPWILHDTDCELNYSETPSSSDVNGWYEWHSDIIGHGRVSHELIDDESLRIEQRLLIFKPFKSLSLIQFSIKPWQDGSEVTWHMQGQMPLLFRPLLPRIKASNEKDFRLGLALLAAQFDARTEHPKISFEGVQAIAETPYVYTAWQGNITEMPDAMAAAWPKLKQAMNEANIDADGQPFTIYKKMKNNGQWFAVEMAVPVAADADTGTLSADSLPAGNYFQTQLKGPYRFLECGWNSAIAHTQMTKTKVAWGKPCLERYENNPLETPLANDLVTSIFLPTKGN